jgi:2-polyprenyl-3-methyl-5-hydroxy-6-metoxy-1,4-benzoquinol methylase
MNALSLAEEIQSSQTHFDAGVLEEFWKLLASPQPKVIDAGCGAGLDLRWFHARGASVLGLDSRDDLLSVARRSGASVEKRDLRLWAPQAGAWDGVWFHRVVTHFSREELQRVLLAFFKALRTGGVLFLSYPLEGWTPDAMGALLLQCGFETLQVAERTVDGALWRAVLARRTGGQS